MTSLQISSGSAAHGAGGRSTVDGAPTEEPRRDPSNARSQRPTTATRAIGVPRALACVCVLEVETPVVAHRCFALAPRSSILCGCIYFPRKQVNAVWGRYPAVCTTYVKQSWRLLGARRQNLSGVRVEKALRVSGVPAVVRSFQLLVLLPWVYLYTCSGALVRRRCQTHAGAPIHFFPSVCFALARRALGIFIHPLCCAAVLYLLT
jgi:hypothetical protein